MHCRWTKKPLLLFRVALALSSLVAGAARADEQLISKVLEEREEFACLSPEESDLINALNAHRVINNLRPIRLSRSLTMVARVHAIDLVENRPDRGTDSRGRACNLHSWSSAGFWSSVCYTGDQRSQACMLNKPLEITGRRYRDVGYENVFWMSAGEVVASRVLETWQQSRQHNALILETKEWRGSNWSALGVGIYRNVAVMWLGSTADPLGSLPPCETFGTKRSPAAAAFPIFGR